jgi:hypothetical protein
MTLWTKIGVDEIQKLIRLVAKIPAKRRDSREAQTTDETNVDQNDEITQDCP